MKLLMLLVLTLAVSACSTSHKLAGCHGPLIVLNADKWRPTAMEIDALGKICPEDK